MKNLSRLLMLVLATGLGHGAAAARPLTVFGAASLTNALEQIGARYEEISEIPVRFSFASSSTLARQIEAGAPADVVALANIAWAGYLARRGLTVPGTGVSPIGNRLTLVARQGSFMQFSDPPTGAEILAALGPHGRLAIGDPAHVPAGIYAREALTALGLWQALEPRLALADNVRAALALAAHGEAPLAIVYATDARAAPGAAPGVEMVWQFPEESHAPIAYSFAAVTGGNESKARDFLRFLSGPEALSIFERHGFTRR